LKNTISTKRTQPEQMEKEFCAEREGEMVNIQKKGNVCGEKNLKILFWGDAAKRTFVNGMHGEKKGTLFN